MKYECGALEELYGQRKAETVGGKSSSDTEMAANSFRRGERPVTNRSCPGMILNLHRVVEVQNFLM